MHGKQNTKINWCPFINAVLLCCRNWSDFEMAAAASSCIHSSAAHFLTSVTRLLVCLN